MGTWGDGLFENDEVLDRLGDILDGVDAEIEKTPAHFIVGLGLLTWLNPARVSADPERFRALLARHSSWVSGASDVVRDRLRALAEDPDAFVARADARPEVTEALGPGCCGPREDALLRLTEAAPLTHLLAERCRARLDVMVADCRQWSGDLYERARELAPLGVLVLLTELGISTPRKQVRAWRDAFELANRNTRDERDFFDGYAARVRKAFDLLEPSSRART